MAARPDRLPGSYVSLEPAIALLCALALAPMAKAGELALAVNDVSGLTTPWPLVASLPFPEGEITDGSAIRIVTGDKEVPAQIDVAATWRDGSIRWALAGFTAPPSSDYRVEYGFGVKRAPHPVPLRLTRDADGRLSVDTGAASYEFAADKLLPERAWLGTGNDRTPILVDSGAGAYLVDNRGRTARVAGAAADVTTETLKEGPGRVVLKRSGWYVTTTGERLARAEAWFYLAAGSSYLRITHSLIFTEDTNKVWVRDYGLEFRTPRAAERVVCAVGEPGKEDIKTLATEGGEVFMLQDTYPHFAERDSRAVIGRAGGGHETVLEEFPASGDWAHGDYGDHGLTVVMPWLADRFPKEISFGPAGARAVLWSGRSGRELDFRAKTLVDEYSQTWAKEGHGKPGAGDLESVKSNAQAAARTHDIWLLPQVGGYDEKSTRTTATAAARPPLVLPDPEWLCATEAMGSYPMLHKDTKRFPAEETLISECWDRLILPLRAFPMTGFIAWGCYPDRSYSDPGGRVMSNFHALTDLREYGLRREPWRLYARSGERRYYEYGRRFSRFTGDWYLAHDDAPGKERGGFTKKPTGGARDGNLPLFWGDHTHWYSINSGVIGHWLLEYYLTGDERPLGLIHMIKESFKKRWKVSRLGAYGHTLKTLVTLSIVDWDEDANRIAREFVRSLIDLESQNGVRGACPIYKDHNTSLNLVEYYLETGDELVKVAFLKLVDQRYRFDRRYSAIAHKNYDAFTYSIAYWMTGDERYRRVVEQTVRDALYYSRTLPLSEDLARKPKNPLDWRSMYAPPLFPGPRRSIILGSHEYQSPFIGLPTALKLLAEKGWSDRRTPLVVKSMDVTQGKVLFAHTQGGETRLSMAFSTVRQGIEPEVVPYPPAPGNSPVAGVKVVMEQRIKWPARWRLRPDEHYHAFVTVPAGTPDGLYLLSLGGNEPLTVLDATTDRVALYCPEGFWSVSGTPIRRKGEGAFGRSGEGMSAFFRVPKDLRVLEILLGRPARVRAPDGSVAVEMSNENIGKMTVPVRGRGGIWSVEPYIHNFKGSCPPAFVRLLNVEPIVAFGTPAHLPEGTDGTPSTRPPSPAAPEQDMEFVAGIAGRAVHLSGERTLSFPRGDPLSTGGYTHFPGATGTAEFWFRPDWSTHEIPVRMTQTVERPLLRGPHLRLLHQYWTIVHAETLYGSLRLELLAEKMDLPSAGAQGQHFFRAGEWTHMAYTWDVKQGTTAMEGDAAIFLNGKRLPPGRFQWYGLNKLPGRPKFTLATKGNDIVLGPFAGAMDVLRLSDAVRYREDFQPPQNAPGIDGHTRALFLFDGNLCGVSAFSGQPTELR